MSKFDPVRLNRQMPAFRNMNIGGELQRLIEGQKDAAYEIGEAATALETLPSVVVVPLLANGTTKVYAAKPTARTVSGIRVRRQTALASDAGTLTLEIKNAAGARLISTPGIDAKTLTDEFVAQALTGTVANLDLVAGEAVEISLTSNNADATGGPAIVELSYT